MANDTELFNKDGVIAAMNKMGDIFSNIAKTYNDTSVDITTALSSPDQAMWGSGADKLLSAWDSNAPLLDDFMNTFENWSALVTGAVNKFGNLETETALVKDLDIENGDKVLPKNEKYQYDWRFNLCNGSVASFDIDDDVLDNINKIVSKITSLFDVKFCSIDIIKTVDNKYYVLEINSGVMMSHLLNENPDYRKTIKNIYTEAILMHFKNN